MIRFAINTWNIGRTIGIEAIRRREIYVVVLIATALLVALRFVKFFDLSGMNRFYRETSLFSMNIASALVVILLAARQLPREFKNRTLYPLLAKPISRAEFLLGKFLGVMLAGSFCYALFMVIFLIGSWTLGARTDYALFSQGVWLQMMSLAIVASMTMLLSLPLNIDAAITISTVLFLSSQVLMRLLFEMHEVVDPVRQWLVLALHYIIPQLTLFDLSGKITHEIWGPIDAKWILILTAYSAVYSTIFLGGAYLLFRRRAL